MRVPRKGFFMFDLVVFERGGLWWPHTYEVGTPLGRVWRTKTCKERLIVRSFEYNTHKGIPDFLIS